MSDARIIDSRAPLLPSPQPDRFQLGVGVAFIGVVVVIWNISGVLTQRIFGPMAFNDPIFLTNVSLSCFSLCHIPKLCSRDDETDRDSSFTPSEIRLLSAKFVLLWTGMCYSSNLSLAKTTLSSNMLLSSTSSVFTLLMGRIVNKHSISIAKVVGVVASVIGTAIIALHDSSPISAMGRSSLFGDLVALFSAILCSVYSVSLAKCIGDCHQNFSFLSFFGWMGQYGLWLGMPLIAIMHISGLHTLPVLNVSILTALLVNGIISMVSDFLWVKSVLMTTPLIATVGLSTSIPIAMVFDAIFNDLIPTSFYLIGSFCILFGFFLINIEQLTMGQRLQIDPESEPSGNIPQLGA